MNLSNSDIIHALTVDRSTSFWSAEGSWVVPLAKRGASQLAGILGVRYMEYKDRFRATAFDEDDDLAGTDNDIDRTNVSVRNRMFGPQIGLQGSMPLFSGLSIGGNVKLGLLHNNVSVDTSFSSDNNPTNGLSRELSGSTWAKVAEFNPQLSFSVNNNIDLTVGGMPLYMDGIGEAASQFSGVADRDNSAVNKNGDAFFYGVSVGAKIKLN